MPGTHRQVAIIGAGPAGLVAAKYLRQHGFECVLFEQSDDIGGQWNAKGEQSGVWPGMRTNTSRVLTCFSDLRHEPGTATYPTNQEVLSLLKRYAAQFDLGEIRLRTRVEALERRGEGFTIRSSPANGASKTESFDRVVVAPGRYNQPVIAPVPGRESFTGAGGVIHSFRYKDPERYRGLRVLVAGCAISALEIASDLAMLGARRVVTAYRRQRYVLPKLVTGVPLDHLLFTRCAALGVEAFPPEVSAERLKEFVLRVAGSPAQFGAPAPPESIVDAGITLSQHFLPLVAEGRIGVKPWLAGVSGQRVSFADGSQEDFDALIFATGFQLSLPFLSDEIRRTLDLDAENLDLFQYTFHPRLPGLAFLGVHDQVGPYFPVLELQARWVAYVWAGVVQAPAADEMTQGVAQYRSRRGQPQKTFMHQMALLFSRAAGVEPALEQYPELTRALLFGPLSPASFRLSGPDATPQAAEQCTADAAAFGAILSPYFTSEESAQLRAVRERQAGTASTQAA